MFAGPTRPQPSPLFTAIYLLIIDSMKNYLPALLALTIWAGTSCNEENPETQPSPLDVPGGIAVHADCDAAEISWNVIDGAASYTVQLRNAAEETSEQKVTENRARFDALEPESKYGVRVRALAETAALDSDYSEWKEFNTTTVPVLSTPAGFAVEEITSGSAKAVWEAVENANGYEVELEDEKGDIRKFEAEESPFSLTELPAETLLKARLRAVGDGTGYLDSEFTGWLPFTTEEGEIALKFKGGSGTPGDPYLIASPGQLALLAAKVNGEEKDYVSASYKLDADIDLEGRKWTPIGSGAGSDLYNGTVVKAFKGVFDGGGHTVRNLDCIAEADEDGCFAGLFGINEGEIRSLKVTGRVKAASSFTGTQGYSFAGGICAVTRLSSQLTECGFTGSAEAFSSNDPDAVSYAGGICALMESGKILSCEALVGADDTVEAAGCVTSAGGVCAYSASGEFSGNKSTVHGTVKASIAENANRNALSIVTNAGGVIGATFSVVMSGCNADIGGEVKSINPYGNAMAGGICGSTEADIFAGCSVEVSGVLTAESAGGNTYAGGIVGLARGAYGLGNMQADIAGTLSSVSDASDGSAFLGGIGALIGNTANSINSTWCSARLSGKMQTTSQNVAYIGGIFGQSTGTVYNSSFVMDEGAKADLSASGGQLCFGGIVGAAGAANVTASYSIIDGTVSASGASLIQSGGITGSIGGAMASQRRSATGCYSLVGGDISAAASGNAFTGAITGATGRYGSMTECWWWSGGDIRQANGTNGQASGASEFADRSRTAMEAALPALNEAIAGYAVRYEYDAAKQYLVLISTE